ncbi:aminotransferase [Usnea florida]
MPSLHTEYCSSRQSFGLTSTRGWATPHRESFGPLQFMPTASVLHYATECFEGLKYCNIWRILKGSIRISLLTFEPDEPQKLIEALVAVESEKWSPKSRPGTFLYLRPTMIATAAALGGNPIPQSSKARVGLKLLASKEDTVHAWPGGFGYAKLVTAPLDDKIILDGVTRRRILYLARERLGRDVKSVEKRYGMSEMKDAAEEGRLLEAFTAVTAMLTSSQVSIAPVRYIHVRGQDLEYTAILKTLLANIMYERKQHEWGVVVNERHLNS